jgi:hypothetical protein
MRLSSSFYLLAVSVQQGWRALSGQKVQASSLLQAALLRLP